MRRREFSLGLGGAAIAPSFSPTLTALAQQPERMRRIGILMNLSETDPEAQALVAAFLQELERLGWSGGRNARFDMRWAAGNPERIRTYAAELAALAPDVLLGYAGSVVRPLQQATQRVPIVFAGAIDPVAAGLVASLAKPGANTTGFMQLEYTVSGKWLDLLKDVAPGVTRVGVLRNLSSPGAAGQWTALETAAPTFGIALSPLDVSDGGDIERAIATFARGSNDGLIILLSPLAAVHRDLIIALAARHRLPAVYPYRYFAGAGGLISYGPVLVDSFRRAAGYVDRILKGEKPADLPVQAPVKHELAVNLKTAKALGLTIPDKLLALADEVIE